MSDAFLEDCVPLGSVRDCRTLQYGKLAGTCLLVEDILDFITLNLKLSV